MQAPASLDFKAATPYAVKGPHSGGRFRQRFLTPNPIRLLQAEG